MSLEANGILSDSFGDLADLRYVTDEAPGFRRRRARDGEFAYLREDGEVLADSSHLARIRALAIPPAWTDVWICPIACGHLQATGRDAKGRKQYRYHAAFREARESAKFVHMMEFARVLPTIRNKVDAHMGLRGLPREKILATVVHLLETTLIRIGNDDYATRNRSFGLTTLRNRHASVKGAEVRFQFRGKSGKLWSLAVKNRSVAKIIRSCQELPGQQLLQYVGDDGEVHSIDSSDVNEYLRDISGASISAKDFRTWAGTLLAALTLAECEPASSASEAKRNIKAAIQRVSARLGNTPAICRKCYVHPEILDCYTSGQLRGALLAARATAHLESALPQDEAMVAAFLAASVAQAAA